MTLLDPAPFYADVAEGPEGVAHWLRTADGVRIRVGVWPVGDRGTVILFPGRTEYAEKYGRMAGELAERGYAAMAIDWRGQGLADRPLPDRMVGHVAQFHDFQHDVAATMTAASQLNLPRPYYLIGHSMGGCIGLRALLNGMQVNAAAFSAPMWGLSIRKVLRPVAWGLSTGARLVGMGGRYAPGTTAQTYVAIAPYEDNVLTTDPDQFAYMKRQVTTYPQLALGGPSLTWVNEALLETRSLRHGPMPPHPTLTALGSRERVTDPAAIRFVMNRWPAARLEVIEDAEHEIIMETPAIRARFLDLATGLFAAHT